VLTRLLAICAYVQGTTLESGNGKTNWTESTGKALAVTAGAAAGLWLGPDGVVWGAMSGALLEPPAVRMIERMQQGMQRRCKKVADIASETAGLSSEELYARICEDEKLQVLTFKAMDAATRTAWEDKLRTLGRSLACGVLASDEARFSTEQRIMAAIGDIEDAELALLDLLVAWRLGESEYTTTPVRLDIPEYSHSQRSDRRWSLGQRKWFVNAIQTYRPRLTPLLPALIGTLQGHGLITYESNVGSPGSILDTTPNPGPYAEPTQLGELVWMRFDGAGANVPHAWTTPATSSEG
jgi:hypothetical protein